MHQIFAFQTISAALCVILTHFLRVTKVKSDGAKHTIEIFSSQRTLKRRGSFYFSQQSQYVMLFLLSSCDFDTYRNCRATMALASKC